MIASTLSRVPLRLYDGEEVTQGTPLALLLERPNQLMRQGQFLRVVVSHLLLEGNAYIYLDQDNSHGVPRALLPFPPQRITPRRDKRNLYSLTGYEVATDRTNTAQIVPPDRMIHLQYAPNPSDPLEGIGPLGVAQIAIESDHLAGVWNRAVLQNSGSPAGVLRWKGEGRFDEEDARLVKDQWVETYGGAEHAESIAVLGSNFEFQSIGTSARDMQWLEARRWNLADIARAFNVPLLFLNEYESSGLSDAGLKIQSKLLYTSNVIPLAVDLAQTFTDKLVTPRQMTQHARFDFTGVEALRDDASEQVKLAQGLTALGYSLNDVNERLGLGMPEVDHGDVAFVSNSLVPVDQVIGAGAEEADPFEAWQELLAAEEEAHALDPAQASAIVDVAARVGKGELTVSAAHGLLVVVFGMSDEQADAILGGFAEPQEEEPEPEQAAEEPTEEAAPAPASEPAREAPARPVMRALRRDLLHERTGLAVLALVFASDEWTATSAGDWARDLGYEMGEAQEAEGTIRLASTRHAVGDFRAGSLRSQPMPGGVIAVLGRLEADYRGPDGEWMLPEARRMVWQTRQAVARRRERDLEKAVKAVFNRWRRDALRTLDKLTQELGEPVGAPDARGYKRAEDKRPTESIIDEVLEAIETGSLWRVVRSAAAETIDETAEQAIETLDTYAVLEPDLVEFAASRRPQIVKHYYERRFAAIVSISDEVIEAVRDTLIEGYVEGENLADMMDRVRVAFDGRASVSRARTIARTETLIAQSAARNDTYRNLGVERHEWLSQGDSVVRPTHRIDGEVRKIGEAFSNGTTAPGEDPSDRAGEIINCRCDTLPVLESAEALAWFPETQLPAPDYTV